MERETNKICATMTSTQMKTVLCVCDKFYYKGEL